MLKLFINYAKEDFESANKLCRDLKENSDVQLWIDKDSLLVGDKWKLDVRRAIEEATFFIALLSKKSTTKSGHVQVEIRKALEKMKTLPEGKRFILPVRLQECNSSFSEFEEIQRVDMFPSWQDGLKKLLKVVAKSRVYLGRRARASLIKEQTEDYLRKIKGSADVVDVRMRATWTSMSNIAHYQGKDCEVLSPDRAGKLDQLLSEERDIILNLLNLDCIKLKCICCPKVVFLSDETYSLHDKQERIEGLKSFLVDSISNRSENREVLCDMAGAYGNQLLIGNQFAIVANPQSGGYTETSVFREKQVVDVLTREYDHLFKRIMRNMKIDDQIQPKDGQSKFLLHEALRVLNSESLTLI